MYKGSPASLRLRQHLQALENRGRKGRRATGLGAPALDRALPWGGLPQGGLHEVAAGQPGSAAAAGFAAGLAARFAGARGIALWCRHVRDRQETGALYGPGLHRFGLPPARLILVETAKPLEVLWAMEEGLRSKSLGVVVGEVAALDLTASRRLQLAAEAADTAALLLRPQADRLGASVALTRWLVDAAPGAGARLTDAPMFDVHLLRCRGGQPGQWRLEWKDGAFRLALPAALADRPAAARAGH